MTTQTVTPKKLITPERVKLVLSVLAVLFLAAYAWQTKNVGDLAWTIAMAVWLWPEREDEKKN